MSPGARPQEMHARPPRDHRLLPASTPAKHNLDRVVDGREESILCDFFFFFTSKRRVVVVVHESKIYNLCITLFSVRVYVRSKKEFYIRIIRKFVLISGGEKEVRSKLNRIGRMARDDSSI